MKRGKNRTTETFSNYAERAIARMRTNGKRRTAETYEIAMQSFRRFTTKEVTLDEIDSQMMERYEAYLQATMVCKNTTSFYMRNLRAIYNRAVKDGLVTDRKPFRYVYTGIDKTQKRGLTENELRRLAEMKLGSAKKEFARDIFMFSFYTRGMAFVDIAHLKKSNLHSGVLTYRRQKNRSAVASEMGRAYAAHR